MSDPQRFSRRQRLLFWLAANLGGRCLRLLLKTCRVSIDSPQAVQTYLVERQPAIAVTWHRGAIFFLYLFGPWRPAIMVSRSKDGELLARFISLMGGIPVRGSSSRGGGEALLAMAEQVKRGEVSFAATVADGPRGPRYQAKPGMIRLAAMTGLPLLPIMWSADRVWTFHKAWDRAMLPKPFAKVVAKAGRELRYPPELGREQLAAACAELDQELNRLRAELDQHTGYQDPA
ncbi:MAG: lysophospholipid acyltransferase family protein [Pseudomonadota bacterium]